MSADHVGERGSSAVEDFVAMISESRESNRQQNQSLDPNRHRHNPDHTHNNRGHHHHHHASVANQSYEQLRFQEAATTPETEDHEHQGCDSCSHPTDPPVSHSSPLASASTVEVAVASTTTTTTAANATANSTSKPVKSSLARDVRITCKCHCQCHGVSSNQDQVSDESGDASFEAEDWGLTRRVGGQVGLVFLANKTSLQSSRNALTKISSQIDLDWRPVGSPILEALRPGSSLRELRDSSFFKLSVDQFCDSQEMDIVDLNLTGTVFLPVTPGQVAAYIKTNKVKSVRFSGCHISEDFLDPFFKALQSSLIFLDLSSIQLKKTHLTSLVDQFVTHGINNISLAGNNLGNEICDILSSSPLLRNLLTLDLSNNEINDEGIVPLMSHEFSQLSTLLLSGNCISNIGASVIGQMLSRNCTLLKLDLSGNKIEDGIQHIFTGLERNHSLQSLNLNKERNVPNLLNMLEANSCLSLLLVHGTGLARNERKILSTLNRSSELKQDLKKKLGESTGEKIVLRELKLMTSPDFVPINSTNSKFQALKTVDLSMNLISEFPYNLANLLDLQVLNLSKNKISCVTKDIAQFSKLSKLATLDLSGNCLTTVSSEIGLLTCLKTLNISHNRLEDLPSGIAALMKDQTLVNYSNNNLSELCKEPSVPLETILEKSVSLNKTHLWVSFRVMLLGDYQDNKSAVLSALGAQPLYSSELLTVSTLDLKQFHFQIFNFSQKAINRDIPQFFMTPQTIFIFPFDGSSVNPQSINHWSRLVTSATHCYTPNRAILFLAANSTDWDPRLNWGEHDVFWPSPTTNVEVEFLDKIKDFLYKGACRMQRVVPGLWPVLARTITQLDSQEIILWRDLLHLARRIVAGTDMLDTLLDAIIFLHNVGQVSYFADIKEWNTIFMNPAHLAAILFAPLSASNKPCVSQNILERELWRVFHHTLHRQFLSLLVRFNVIIPIEIQGPVDPGPGYLIPSNLMESEPEGVQSALAKLHTPEYHVHCRLLLFDRLPSCFVSQIQAALLQLPKRRTSEFLWKSGAMISTQSGTPDPDEAIHITVCNIESSEGLKIYAYEPTSTPTLLCLAMDSIIQILSTIHPPIYPSQHSICCLGCLHHGESPDSASWYDSNDIITNFSHKQHFTCTKCNSLQKPSTLAPDLCAGVAPKTKLACTDVEITNLLGRGGYGTVFKAELKHPDGKKTTTAVKIWRNTDISQTLTEFRQEVEVMAQLPDNPHLVPLLGVSIQPVIMMVMEFAQHGDLRSLLNSSEPISSALVYRIALDVAKGLHALHNVPPNGFIHRDLRSPNIFIISKDIHASVCAKVGDYGLTTRSIMTTSTTLGTWRWLAPEVLSQNANYGLASDIYSFGMILLELVNPPHEPFWELDHKPGYSKTVPQEVYMTPTKTYSEEDLKDARADCQSFGPQLPEVEKEITQIRSQMMAKEHDPLCASTDLIEEKSKLEGKISVLEWKRTLLTRILDHAQNIITVTKTAERVVREISRVNEQGPKELIINGLRPEIPTTCPLALRTLILNCWEREALRPDAQALVQLLTTAVRYQEELDGALNQIIDMYDLQLIAECSPENKIRTICSVHTKGFVVLTLDDGKILRCPSFPEKSLSPIPYETATSSGFSSRKVLFQSASQTVAAPTTKKPLCSAFVSGRVCIGTSDGRIYFLPENQVEGHCSSPQQLTLSLEDSLTLEGFHSFIIAMCDVTFNGQHELWCCCDGSPEVLGIDVVKRTLIRRIALGPGMIPVCILQCANQVWVGTAKNCLCVINIDSSVVNIIPSDGKVSKLAHIGDFVFALLQKSTLVHIWHCGTLRWLCRIDLSGPVGKGTQGVLSAICIGLDKVWTGDNTGDIIGWDFSGLLVELSSAVSTAHKADTFSAQDCSTIFTSAGLTKSACKPEPFLQTTLMPIPIAYGCMVQKARSQQFASARVSTLTQSNPPTAIRHCDIPLVGDMHFWPDSDSSKSGYLWAITTSGPRMVCCFKLVLQQFDTGASRSSFEPIEFLLPNTSIPPPTEIVVTKAPSTPVSALSRALFSRKLVSGKLTFSTGQQVKCKLTQYKFTTKSASGFKGLEIPTTDITCCHMAGSTLRIDYKDSGQKRTIEFHVPSDQRAQWQVGFERANIPHQP
ncbi:leucine-rich repeat-containing protein [Pelomyxa schiedti]|nr:leucine-rich repeat-containing protein [Pelomyxa schiedti]